MPVVRDRTMSRASHSDRNLLVLLPFIVETLLLKSTFSSIISDKCKNSILFFQILKLFIPFHRLLIDLIIINIEKGCPIRQKLTLLAKGHPSSINYLFSSLISIPNSTSCLGSTIEGASVIMQDASFTFGNAITSRMLSAPTISMTTRSRP